MTPQQIMDGMAEKQRLLTAKNDEYIDLVEDRAQKERSYSKIVSEQIISLRLESTPITILKDIAKGGIVADMKYELDVAVGVEKACLNQIKILTSQIDTYRSLLSWLKAEMQSQ